MADFGYASVKSGKTDLDIAGNTLSRAISEAEPGFNLCIACGCCVATCSAGRFTRFGFRELIHRIKRGEEKLMIAEAEKCMLCGKCTLVCPRNINTRNIVLLIRKHAVIKGL
ncbi:MAG: 4Fe-4S dicluster domain-containing protein [Lentimicrobium sp.]|nr:4Fe-4S dicluster domain-containing protein [Lentimicrobium sp.]